jgi:hypothetical protein
MRFASLVLTALFFSGLAVGQTTTVRGYAGYYGCGPYIPLVTTPQISLETVAPSPVGASNATYGLVAGASNATLSIVSSNVSPTYIQPVWYQGGTTPWIVSPEVQLPFAQAPVEVREREQRREERREAGARAWTYYASEEKTASPVEAAQAARTGKHAARAYTNQDVERQSQKNGLVHYDNKTEQIK